MVGVSCRGYGDGQPGTPAWGDGESCAEGGRSVLQGLWGRRTGHTCLGGWGVPPRGWSEFPCRACGDGQPGPPAWGDGESCPGGGRSILQGLWGRRTGHTGLGGWGAQPRGWSEFPAGPVGMDNRAHRPGGMGSPAQGVVGASCRANGGPSSLENRAHRPGGDGESCPGGVRSLLPGLRGAIFFREPGAPARGGRGVLPRGCLDPPARPMGGHLVLCCIVLCCVVLCCVVLCCAVLCCVVLYCVVLCCVVLRCVVVCCAEGAVTRRQWPGCLPTGTGKREGYVSKCALCASVLLYSRTSALSHLAGIALPTPVHSHTGSSRATAPCVPCCTISAFCVVLHCLVLCTALHRVCPAALHLWAEGSGQWISCNPLPHCLEAVGSATPPTNCLTACGQWAGSLP